MDLIINDKLSVEKEFDRIAKLLLCDYYLQVQEESYYLTEVEFYYHSERHPDPFVHLHLQQKENSQWYFHASGVDVCIGNKANNATGGVLIRGIKSRAIQKEGKWRYTDGPIKVYQQILNSIGTVLLQENIKLGFCKRDVKEKITISKYHRIGLNPKGKNNGEDYAARNYRYISDVEVVAHKFKQKTLVRTKGKKLVF